MGTCRAELYGATLLEQARVERYSSLPAMYQLGGFVVLSIKYCRLEVCNVLHRSLWLKPQEKEGCGPNNT